MNTWEDTVLKENQIGSRPLYCFADEEMIRLGLSRLELFRLCKDAGFLNTQAELTYHSRDSEVAEARKAGREDVAEYIDTHCYNSVSGWHLCTLDIEAFRRGEIPEKTGY